MNKKKDYCNVCLIFTTTFILHFMVSGCCKSIVYDVSSDKETWGDYVLQKSYVTLTDVFFVKAKEECSFFNNEEQLYIIPPLEVKKCNSPFCVGIPSTIEEYLLYKEGKCHKFVTDEVVGIIKAGTHIMCVNTSKEIAMGIVAHRGDIGGASKKIHIYGQLMDGSFKDKIVDLQYVSEKSEKDTCGYIFYGPDPIILKDVSIPDESQTDS